MLSPWTSSSSRRVRAASNFACSSFKDVPSLFVEDDEPQSQSLQRKKRSIFHRVRLSAALLRHWSAESRSHQQDPSKRSPYHDLPIYLPGSVNRVVFYSTSLHVVRKTFDDCRTVRSILRGFRVAIDERDLVMDSRFSDELQGILGPAIRTRELPRVFIGGRYVGGADEIVRLNESGELKEFIQGLKLDAAEGLCKACGGHGFILCEGCSGSRKFYDEKTGFRICPQCNENGLTRCSSCVCVVSPVR